MAGKAGDRRGGSEVGTARSRLLDRILDRGALRRWERAAREAADTDLLRLLSDRAHARALRHAIDEHLAVADQRLTLPLVGSTSFPRPHGTDWSWRPALWRLPVAQRGLAGVAPGAMLGPELTVFHDCRQSEITVRQVRNAQEADLAPFGLRLEVFRFDGSFLSLVLDLPPEAAEGLRRRHILRADVTVEAERPLGLFARLNVRHGPNEEQLLRALPPSEAAGPGAATASVEFDLAYTKLNEKRVEKLWLDLIFEAPQMNQVTLRDLTLLRHPRADF
jgi:hypothetical protein